MEGVYAKSWFIAAVVCTALIISAHAEEKEDKPKIPSVSCPADAKPGGKVLVQPKEGMSYFLRVPTSYDVKKGARIIVFLHGSNMNGLMYLDTIESCGWCAEDVLVCPNGEEGYDPFGANNFTFGSAKPVATVVTAVQKEFKATRTYIGGHSQGGFVTYSCIMLYPALFQGAMPMSADCWMQNEPNLWEGKPAEINERRRIAIAVIHGRQDPVVEFSQGQHAHDVFDAMAWPALKFFAPDNLGHEFALSPVPEALAWLDAVKGCDSAHSLSCAEKWAAACEWADAVPAALCALEDKKLASAAKAGANAVLSKAEKAAKPEAEAVAKVMQKSPSRIWLPQWFAFRRKFGLTKAAERLTQFYDACRAKEHSKGVMMFDQALGFFKGGNKPEGYRILEELLEKAPHTYEAHYAVKWLDERDKGK